MGMTIDERNARLDEIKVRMTEIDSEYATELLPAEEQAEYDSLRQELVSHEAVIEQLELRRSQLAEIGTAPEAREELSFQTRRPGVVTNEDIYDLSTVRGSFSNPAEMMGEVRDRAKRANERAEFPHEGADKAEVQGHVEKLLQRDSESGEIARRLLTTGSPAYRRAFAKLVTGANLSPEEQRAMSLTGSAGGYAVPFVLDPTIVPTSNGVVNPIRQIANVKSVVVDTWKGATSAGVTATYKKEGAESEDNSPTLGQPEVSAERADVFIPASYEIGQDWGSIASELALLIQDAKDTLEATAFLTGDGSDEPYGVLTGATTTVTSVEKEAFKVADIYALKGALPPRFRPNAVWLANDAIYDRVRQFDTNGGANMWVQIEDGRPANLVGKPAYELSTMNAEVKAEKKNMIYGDFSKYLIIERIGMSIKLIPDLFGENGRPTGQSGFYAFWRNGAKVIVPGAFRVLEGAKE